MVWDDLRSKQVIDAVEVAVVFFFLVGDVTECVVVLSNCGYPWSTTCVAVKC